MKSRCITFFTVILAVVMFKVCGVYASYSVEYSTGDEMNYENSKEEGGSDKTNLGSKYYYASMSELQSYVAESETVPKTIYIRFFVDSGAKDDSKTTDKDWKACYTDSEDKEQSISISLKSVENSETKDWEEYGSFKVTESNKDISSYEIKCKRKNAEGNFEDVSDGSISVDVSSMGEGGGAGNDPTAEAYFKVGTTTIAKTGTTYRKYESITPVLVAKDEGTGESGVKYYKFGTKEETLSQAISTKEVTGDVLKGPWEKIQSTSMSYTVKDAAGKSVSGNLSLSPLVEKKKDIDFEYVSDFKPYLIDGNVVLKIRVYYGEEYVSQATIKNKQSGTAEIIGQYTKQEKVDGYDTNDTTTVRYLIVNTKATPDKDQGLSFDYTSNGTKNSVVKNSPPSVDQVLKDGYNQEFDISKGNIKIDADGTVHFAKDVRGTKGEGETDSEEGSTVKIRGDAFILKGTTTQYTVENNLAGKIIILKSLDITTSNKSAIAISGDTIIKPDGTSKIKSTGSNNAINISNGTLEVSGDKRGKIEIECTAGGAGIGATNGANIKVTHNQELTIKTKDGAGIGSGQGGTVGSIHVVNPNITITCNGSGAGIGGGKAGKVSSVKVEGKNLIITQKGDGAGIGSGGGSGSTVGDVTVENLNLNVTVNTSSGCGIGAGNNGKCEKIQVTGCNVKLEGISSYKLGAGIGAAQSGKSSDITINNSYVKINKANVGVGANTSGECDNIKIENSSGLDITADCGIGSKGTCQGINIKNSNVKITAENSGVGIGSFGGTCSSIDLTKTNVSIEGGAVGIGTGSGTLGNIKLTSCDKIIASASDVGIGCKSANNSSKSITISGCKVEIKNTPTVGIGSKDSAGKLGDVEICASSEIKIAKKSGDTSSIGIGTTGTLGNIKINNSKLDLGVGAIGIGAGSNATMGNITIEKDSNVIAYGSNVCIGSKSSNTQDKTISIDSSKVKVEGSGVGIGASGKIGNISITSCDSIDVKANIGIGGGSDATVSKITIGESKLKITGNSSLEIGVGSGKFENESTISISNSILDIGTISQGAGIGVESGELSNLEVADSAIKIVASGTGAGIGCGTGTVNTIKINKNIIGILQSGSGAAIGSGKSGKVVNMEFSKNKMVLKNGSGAGIGSGESGSVTGTIKIDKGVFLLKNGDGAAIGSGKSGSAKDIEIENARIYVWGGGSGAGIGGGESENITGTTKISKGQIVLNMSGSGAGIGKGNLEIKDGKIRIKGTSGSGISVGNIKIDEGDIEIAISGSGNGIKGSSGSINSGVIKTYSENGYAINGNINITDNANVQAIGKVSGVSGTQKKLTQDLLRHTECLVCIGGDQNNTIQTDKSGNIYYWGNATEFHVNGMKLVI